MLRNLIQRIKISKEEKRSAAAKDASHDPSVAPLEISEKISLWNKIKAKTNILLFVFAVIFYGLSFINVGGIDGFLLRISLKAIAFLCLNIAIIRVLAGFLVECYLIFVEKRRKLESLIKYSLIFWGIDSDDLVVREAPIKIGMYLERVAFVMLILLCNWLMCQFFLFKSHSMYDFISGIFVWIASECVNLSIFAIWLLIPYLAKEYLLPFVYSKRNYIVEKKISRNIKVLSLYRIGYFREHIKLTKTETNKEFTLLMWLGFIFSLSIFIYHNGFFALSIALLIKIFVFGSVLGIISCALVLTLYPVMFLDLSVLFLLLHKYLPTKIVLDDLDFKEEKETINGLMAMPVPLFHQDINDVYCQNVSLIKNIIDHVKSLEYLFFAAGSNAVLGFSERKFLSKLKEHDLRIEKVISKFLVIVKNERGEYIRNIWNFEHDSWDRSRIIISLRELLSCFDEELIENFAKNSALSRNKQGKHIRYEWSANLYQWIRYEFNVNINKWLLDLRSVYIPYVYLLPELSFIMQKQRILGHTLLSFDGKILYSLDSEGNMYKSFLKKENPGFIYYQDNVKNVWVTKLLTKEEKDLAMKFGLNDLI